MCSKTKLNAAKKKKASQFLETNPLAKIVVVLDSHSASDGDIFTGASSSDQLGPVCPGDLSGSSWTNPVNKILQRFLPGEVAAALASPSSAVHNHRAFILNMTCGASVMNEQARDQLIAKYVYLCVALCCIAKPISTGTVLRWSFLLESVKSSRVWFLGHSQN